MDDFAGPGIQPFHGGAKVAYAPTDATGGQAENATDNRAVLPASQRGIQVDHRNLPCDAEALCDRQGVAGIQRFLPAADELDGAAGHQVN